MAADGVIDNSAMRTVNRSALVAQPAEKLFALIDDVERYPEFVPWCTHARVESRTADEVVATLGVKRGPLRTEFTTRNRLLPPEAVQMTFLRGPFRRLEGEWRVQPLGDSGCRVTLTLSFQFAAGFPSALFDPVFEETAASLVDAFVSRARVAPV